MDYHTSSYSSEFKKLIYSNICDNLDKIIESTQTFS